MKEIEKLKTYVKADNHQICTKCVLDTSETGIYFDSMGVCNFCLQFEKSNPLQTQQNIIESNQLNNLIDKVKLTGKNNKYDCIIGLSGGVDSSYLAWLVKEKGLRPLAVHFDNGWNSEIAVGNIEQTCKNLEIELYTYVVDWEEFRDLQLSFLKAGVANAEAPTDHGIFATLYNLAAKFKIKFIIDGVNIATEFVRKDFQAAGWAYADLKHLKAIHRRFGSIPLKTFPTLSLYKKFWLQKVIGIRQISLLNYIDYNKNEAIELLKNKLGWRSYGSKHHESTFTKWHQVVYLPTRFGFDKRKFHLSDLILFNQISRKEALNQLTQPSLGAKEKAELEEYVQKKLGLSKGDYSTLIYSNPVPYTAYPNNAALINLYQKYKGI